MMDNSIKQLLKGIRSWVLGLGFAKTTDLANYATLVDGKVPASQLPSYVDDVLEFDNKASFPATGESGKIYVDKSNNTTWRWSGESYVQIKGDLVIGTVTGTAYDGGSGAALATAVAGKQDTLSDAQLAAANSGITTEKVATYDGYATTIASKYEKPSTGIPASDLASGVIPDVANFVEKPVSPTENTKYAYTSTGWSAITEGGVYSAGTGISITDNTISVDNTVVATTTQLNAKQDTISDLATIRTNAEAGKAAKDILDGITQAEVLSILNGEDELVSQLNDGNEGVSTTKSASELAEELNS